MPDKLRGCKTVKTAFDALLFAFIFILFKLNQVLHILSGRFAAYLFELYREPVRVFHSDSKGDLLYGAAAFFQKGTGFPNPVFGKVLLGRYKNMLHKNPVQAAAAQVNMGGNFVYGDGFSVIFCDKAQRLLNMDCACPPRRHGSLIPACGFHQQGHEGVQYGGGLGGAVNVLPPVGVHSYQKIYYLLGSVKIQTAYRHFRVKAGGVQKKPRIGAVEADCEKRPGVFLVCAAPDFSVGIHGKNVAFANGKMRAGQSVDAFAFPDKIQRKGIDFFQREHIAARAIKCRNLVNRERGQRTEFILMVVSVIWFHTYSFNTQQERSARHS